MDEACHRVMGVFDTIPWENYARSDEFMAETFGELRQDLKTMATRLADFGRSL
ncbi:hypothetical protein Alches_27920 [Alicyclobacillus hesperidum subsp. aegles]|nr:hypothetical protein Alches_27920 [Alicyclobacillus hesperidum subsp. aegles]